MTCIAGIDPGLTGAISMLDMFGNLIKVVDMPTVAAPLKKRPKNRNVDPVMLRQELELISFQQEIELVVIELVASSSQMGVASAFKFGRGLGVIEGVCGIYPTLFVTPQTWQKPLGLIGKAKAEGVDKKTASLQLARDLWPDQADRFSRKKDDGRADAALIAAYGLWHITSHNLTQQELLTHGETV